VLQFLLPHVIVEFEEDATGVLTNVPPAAPDIVQLDHTRGLTALAVELLAVAPTGSASGQLTDRELVAALLMVQDVLVTPLTLGTRVDVVPATEFVKDDAALVELVVNGFTPNELNNEQVNGLPDVPVPVGELHVPVVTLLVKVWVQEKAPEL